jgi:hypothetical protein
LSAKDTQIVVSLVGSSGIESVFFTYLEEDVHSRPDAAQIGRARRVLSRVVVSLGFESEQYHLENIAKSNLVTSCFRVKLDKRHESLTCSWKDINIGRDTSLRILQIIFETHQNTEAQHDWERLLARVRGRTNDLGAKGTEFVVNVPVNPGVVSGSFTNPVEDVRKLLDEVEIGRARRGWWILRVQMGFEGRKDAINNSI